MPLGTKPLTGPVLTKPQQGLPDKMPSQLELGTYMHTENLLIWQGYDVSN